MSKITKIVLWTLSGILLLQSIFVINILPINYIGLAIGIPSDSFNAILVSSALVILFDFVFGFLKFFKVVMFTKRKVTYASPETYRDGAILGVDDTIENASEPLLKFFGTSFIYAYMLFYVALINGFMNIFIPVNESEVVFRLVCIFMSIYIIVRHILKIDISTIKKNRKIF